MTTPIFFVLPDARAAAFLFGVKLSSSANAVTFFRVSGLTSYASRNARDTVDTEMLSILAMSLIPTCCFISYFSISIRNFEPNDEPKLLNLVYHHVVHTGKCKKISVKS